MRWFLVRTDPVQELAAHPTTLAQLTDVLREHAVEPKRLPALRGIDLGLPLIRDDEMTPGVIHLRPALQRSP